MKQLLVISTLLGLFMSPAVTQAQEPVVYGLFFYSPDCSHCHIVFDHHWDGIQAEFGDQLQVLFVNVQRPEGSALMNQTTRELGIPSNGVPMLILGETALVGSVDIPNRTGPIVRAGLATGGIAPPPVRGMDAIFAEVLGTEGTQNVIETTPTDDIANTVAVGVLLALVLSLAVVGLAFATPQFKGLVLGRPGKVATATWLIAGVGLTLTLVFGSSASSVTALAASLMLLLGLVLFGTVTNRL
ncbi:MAG: hypothetical protein AAF125_08630, partial [Chloroflexota bacterium]